MGARVTRRGETRSQLARVCIWLTSCSLLKKLLLKDTCFATSTSLLFVVEVILKKVGCDCADCVEMGSDLTYCVQFSQQIMVCCLLYLCCLYVGSVAFLGLQVGPHDLPQFEALSRNMSVNVREKGS